MTSPPLLYPPGWEQPGDVGDIAPNEGATTLHLFRVYNSWPWLCHFRKKWV